MWFLGEPHHLIASLNMQNPGPIELDFYGLGTMDQMRVLTAMKNGQIEADLSFEDLYAEWSQKSKYQPPPTGTVANDTAKAIIESRLKAEASRADKETKFQERCVWALGQSVKGLKSLIQNSDDVRFLRTILKMEETGKNRKTVIGLIRERMARFERAIATEAIKDDPNGRDPFKPRETMPYSVVDSEQETIILSPEELIGILAKEP